MHCKNIIECRRSQASYFSLQTDTGKNTIKEGNYAMWFPCFILGWGSKYVNNINIMITVIIKITISSNLIGPQTCISFYLRYNKTNYEQFSINSKGTDNWNKTPETIKKHHHVKNLKKK